MSGSLVRFVTAAIGRKARAVRGAVKQAAGGAVFTAACDANVRAEAPWRSVAAEAHRAVAGAEHWTDRQIVKWYKMVWWRRWVDIDSAKAVVWLDARMQIAAGDVAALAAKIVGQMDAPLAMWPHYSGHLWKKELSAAANMCATDERARLREQGEAYVADGMDRDAPVYTGGFIVFNPKHPQLPTLLDAWFEEQMKWTTRDQVSFPYVCWKLKVQPANLARLVGGTWSHNRLVTIWPHG